MESHGAHPAWERASVSSQPPRPMLRTLTLLAVFVLCIPAAAQSNADAMARLAPFNGTYTLDGTAQIEEGTFDGSLTVSPILDGHFQQWDWEMNMKGEGVDEKAYRFDEKVHLRFIVKYNPVDQEYLIYRFDSRDIDSPTRVSNVEDPSRGRLYFDGDALVMAWAMAGPNGSGQTGTFRNKVRRTAQGLSFETTVTPDDGSPLVAIATTRAHRR